jgi:hypothetical protein
MSLITQPYPFRRLMPDRMTRGQTRIWWTMNEDFNDPGPHVFQLQFGRTGLTTATDWVNVGTPITDAYYAVDDAMRDGGAIITAHYRLTLTTPLGVYVSAPVNPVGFLPEKDWVLAREIIRKEQLRFANVGVEGTILKRLRYGTKCTKCRAALTDEPANGSCLECNGTGFKIGYHAPAAIHCFDLTPQEFDEQQDADARGTIRENSIVSARVLAFPALQKFDVWINNFSDERWIIHYVKHVAVQRGVPLVSEVRMHLAPFSHVIYRVEIGGEPADREGPVLPGTGAGSVTVDHDFGGTDALIYRDAAGCPVVGATILAFTQAVYDAASPGQPAAADAVASSSTAANGRWTYGMNLDPGQYVLVYEKPGHFGPDALPITVVGASSSSSSSSSGSFWDM